ncbi:argininosuccinate lyase [Gemmobacter lutimaris]|uniref:Argininosuccinate lyase n=1 Tax=Gemmobacter lutimaris TaxID=2306023 RepID=A0A398BUX3_9RHOB|nr:argininosuccinate lyase [Gemmobacter lutimaris]RID93347.1 argininosuccinate lyase [Gemmobacter lutimaris]
MTNAGKGLIGLALAALLAGCGADGPPRTPEAQTGVTISGDARVGMTYENP